MLNEKQKELIKSYAREIYLWDNPSDAPSVPSNEILGDFINGKLEDKDLEKQIRNDLNCKMAVDKIKFEKIFGKNQENCTACASEKRCEEQKGVVFKLIGRFISPRKGDIFYTQSKLPVIDENSERSFVYTFKPCAVLLLDDGEEMEWNDRVFRCAVVTPEYMGEAVEGQDMLLENGWVLHKWLSYPLSFYQIDFSRKVGTVDNIDEIADIVEEYSFSDEKMTRYGKAEKRLMAYSEYLPIEADTRKAVFKMKETAAAKAAKLIREMTESTMEFVKNLIPSPVAGSTFGLGISGFAAADTDTSIIVIRKGDCEKVESVKAKLADPIFLSKETKPEDLPTWNFSLEDTFIPEGCVFILRDENGNDIGFGSIYHATDHGVARLMEYFPEKLKSDVINANQVVLEVFIPW